MTKLSHKHTVILAFAALLAAGCEIVPEEREEPVDAEARAQARTMALDAIRDARDAMARVRDPCTDTGAAGSTLDRAESAVNSEDFEEAQRLAARAADEAEQAINDCFRRAAAAELDKARQFTNLGAAQRNRLREGEQAVERGDYRLAYDTLRALNAELQAAATTYRVVPGNSLWRISGRADIYGDSYQWPLIYKENSDKIKDADLIYPDQTLKVRTYPTKSAKERAIEHARTRGPWQLGRTEASDLRYLREAR